MQSTVSQWKLVLFSAGRRRKCVVDGRRKPNGWVLFVMFNSMSKVGEKEKTSKDSGVRPRFENDFKFFEAPKMEAGWRRAW